MLHSTILYEELEVFTSGGYARAAVSPSLQKRRALDIGDQGGLLVSPEFSGIAVLDSTATCITILHAGEKRGERRVLDGKEARTFSHDLATVRSFLPTRPERGSLSSADPVTSYCWSSDGSRLAVACASGHVYILDRSGQPLTLLPPSAGTWAGKSLGALALPSPTVLVLLTARPPQLFTVPLGAPSRTLLALRPQQLGRLHTTVRVAAYDVRTSMLVVAGEGGGAGAKGGGAARASVSVSAWKLELASAGGAAAAAKAVLLGSFAGLVDDAGGGGGAGPAAAAEGGGAAWSRRRWTLSLSPLGEHVALVAPPAPGVLLLSLPQCRRVDPSERFGGRTAPPASAFRTTLARSVESAASAAWWSSETMLALSDLAGYVGLAQLPGYDNLLAGDEQPKFAPGALVASKPSGPGAIGLLVLEPVAPSTSQPESALNAIRSGRPPRGAAAFAESSAVAAAGAPGFRLLLLAERTPEQMLQVHMRNQQWGRALELCAGTGLDADRVYGARWASRPVDGANITDNLAKVADRRWVIAECCRRVAADYEGQRKLINYGLRETARQAKPPAAADDADDASSSASAPAAAGGGGGGGADPRDAAWWWCWRLTLWRHSDRLEVLYAAQGRTFNPAAYTAFRDLPLPAAAGSWAATGAVGPLAVLAQHYPASLSGPVLLGVLSRLPETINPRLYSALLPRAADGEEPSTPVRPPPVRKLDWVEQPEVLAEIKRAIAAGSGSGTGAEMPSVDSEATDALVRILAPRPRLSSSALSEWYADRALQLDAETGQLQGALALLELGWERGARGLRVAQLLGAARALAGVVGGAGQRRGSSVAGGGSAQVPLWRLRLEAFAAMSGAQQLRLLLAGSGEESLAEDLRDRVVPFLRGPGWDACRVGPLVGSLLAEEMAARPGWAAALVEAEARGRFLFSSAAELGQAVRAAVVDCPHTDEWPSLERAVAAAEEALSQEVTEGSAAAEAPAAAAAAAAGEVAAAAPLGALRELRGWVRAGALLAGRGLPLTVRHISSCGREEAARCVRQVLGRVQRSSPSMPDASWSQLWAELTEVRAAAFPALLAPRELLAEVARCMLHCGRSDLANAYTHGGAPGAGTAELEPEAIDALFVSVAAEILAGANDPWDAAAQQSAACLALASPDAPAAVALRRLMSALQLLPELGVDLLPAQVMQMGDRFEVIRLILEGEGQGEGPAAVSLAGGPTMGGLAGLGRVSGGIGSSLGLATSAALGGRFSRRRAAVRAAGRAAAAGGRAAAALAGGLLAVAGRVAGANVAEAMAGHMAPVAGMVAGAVAATVSVAAGAAPGSAGAGGAVHPPYKQVGRLLELAELLGLDSPEDELRLKDLAGLAALRAGDLTAAQHMALGLVAARYVPAWSLCADVGSARQLRDDAARQRLLSYALLYCPPERMARLLEELRAAERRGAGEADADGSAPGIESPEYLLRRALLADGQRAVDAASPGALLAAALPSPGDTHLALAVLSAGGGGGGSEGAAAQLLEGLLGSGDDVSGGGGALPYAQLQCVVAMECYCHCLRALLPGAGSGAERMRLMEAPLGELLQQVRQLRSGSQGSAAAGDGEAAVAAAAEAAVATEARLAAARDSRTVRQHVSGVDAAQFASGGGEYRRQAILQQAALAGAAEAEAPGASQRAEELVEQARRLAVSYGVDPWDVELHFTSALLTTGSAVTPELRAAVQSREPGLLQRPGALLRHLAAVAYPALPPASGPHLALWLAVLTDCLHACAKDDATAATLAAAAAPLLSKLRDLLDKAAAALKGLALTQVHAPLLAPLLAPLGVVLAAPAAPVAPDAGSGGGGGAGAAAAAAAAIFSYVKPSNLAQAAKLVAALHKLLGPVARKAAPAAAAAVGGGAPLLFPDLQAALDALPPSLPYLSLCIKAVGTKSPGSGVLHHNQQQQQAPQSGQRDMAVAWGHVEEHVVRLPAAQLAAWLAFLLLPGSRCPLDPRVTGAPLHPCPCPVDVRLTVLDTCMPKLLTSLSSSPPPAAASAAGPADGGPAASCEACEASSPELLLRLQSLHRRLLVLRAARQHAADELDEQQLRDLELSLLPTVDDSAAACGGGDTEVTGGAVCRALSTLAAAGCPAAVLLDIAAVAVEPVAESGAGGGPPAAAVALVEEAVRGAVGSALAALQEEPDGATTATAAGSGLGVLRGVLKCLDRRPPSHPPLSSSTVKSAAEGSEASAAAGCEGRETPKELETVWRDLVWRELQRFTDERLPSLEQQQLAVASKLLDLLAALGTRAMWPDWSPSGGSSDDPPDRARLRLLTTRTRALLAHLLPAPPPPSPQPHQPAHAPQSDPAIVPAPAPAPAPALAIPSGVQLAVQVGDLETREAAERLFMRLLEAARAGGGGDGLGGGTASLAQLRLLARLLADVWRDGDAWGCEAAVGSWGSADVSPLRSCWRALSEELLRGRHLVELVGLLDPPSSPCGARRADQPTSPLHASTPHASSGTRRLLPLSSDDVSYLVQSATAGGADRAITGLCLGLASPYPDHRRRALTDMEDAYASAAAVDGSGPLPCDTAALLLALLAKSGDVVRLAASCHPLLSRLVASVPASPASAVVSAGQDSPAAAAGGVPVLALDPRPASCVLPCVAALLAERGQCGLAAALVSKRLRLHPALAAAGGSVALLNRYLHALVAPAGADGPRGEEAADGEAASGGVDVGVGLLASWPGAVEALWRGREELVGRALRVLAAPAAACGTAPNIDAAG